MDDGSTDRHSEIVRRFEPRVRLLRKANGGQRVCLSTWRFLKRRETLSPCWTATIGGPRKSCAESSSPSASIRRSGIVGHGYHEVYSIGGQMA